MLAFWELSCLFLGAWLGASSRDLPTFHCLGQGACQRCLPARWVVSLYGALVAFSKPWGIWEASEGMLHENKRQWKEWPASRLQQARTLCPCYYCFMKMPPASWQGLEGEGLLEETRTSDVYFWLPSFLIFQWKLQGEDEVSEAQQGWAGREVGPCPRQSCSSRSHLKVSLGEDKGLQP